MSMLHTFQAGWTNMRIADVTEDDDAFDGVTDGLQCIVEDFPADSYDIPSTANGCEIAFWGQADDGDTFGCEIWGCPAGKSGPTELLMDITGAAGTYSATDNTSDSRFFADDVTISAQYHIKGVSSYDVGNERCAKIAFDIAGLDKLYPRFYNVGGAGEVHRFNCYVRPF